MQATAHIQKRNHDDASELVQRCKEGDHGAFRELFERYHERVHATVFHLVQRKDEIEDVVQNTFLEVYKSIHRFEGRSLFTTWLTRVAIHVARAHDRKLRIFERPRRKEGEYRTEHLRVLIGGLEPSPDEGIDSQQRSLATQEILEKLPFKKRMVLVLADLHDMTAPEIADILDIPPATVRTRLFYARKDFERLAKKHPIFKELWSTRS